MLATVWCISTNKQWKRKWEQSKILLLVFSRVNQHDLSDTWFELDICQCYGCSYSGLLFFENIEKVSLPKVPSLFRLSLNQYKQISLISKMIITSIVVNIIFLWAFLYLLKITANVCHKSLGRVFFPIEQICGEAKTKNEYYYDYT